MDYSLDTVKSLYDSFGIKKNENGNFVIVNRQNGQPMFGSDLEPRVKFAHTWFLARQNGRSRTTADPNITEEEYLRAFDEQARALYDYIMASSLQAVQAGVFLHPETLSKDVAEAIPVAYAKETVEGLYANGNRRESFEKWIIQANLDMNLAQQSGGIKR